MCDVDHSVKLLWNDIIQTGLSCDEFASLLRLFLTSPLFVQAFQTLTCEEISPLFAEQQILNLLHTNSTYRVDHANSVDLSEKLFSLEDIALNSNNLVVLPEGIGHFNQLRRLDVSQNRLSRLPNNIGQLRNLEEFLLVDNLLTFLPPTVWNLTMLHTLDVSGNELKSLSSAVGNLKSLETLGLTANELTSLPPEIGKLTNLKHLQVSRNHLSALPAQVGRLSQLEKLELEGNMLTELPLQIGLLVELQYLSVQKNQLTLCPNTIGSLANLRELRLHENQLGTLPGNIGCLQKLQILTLEENPWISLPHEIQKTAAWKMRRRKNPALRKFERIVSSRPSPKGSPRRFKSLTNMNVEPVSNWSLRYQSGSVASSTLVESVAFDAPLPRKFWQKDKEARFCTRCRREFGTLKNRRHHCRNCGKIYCDKCSSNGINGHRICDICFVPHSSETMIL